MVTRDASTSCVQNGTSGNGQWCCQKDVCNNAKIIELSILIMIFVIYFLFE
jgi:hypothetical protein